MSKHTFQGEQTGSQKQLVINITSIQNDALFVVPQLLSNIVK